MESRKVRAIVIYGKSAAGKDTFAKRLVERLGDEAHMVVSDTSRPPRPGEVDGVDYNFVSRAQTYQRDYIEGTEFRGWFYGTPVSGIDREKINVLVLNPVGVANVKWGALGDADVIYVRVQAPLSLRLTRYARRAKRVTLEMFRRVVADYFMFQEFNRRFPMPREEIVVNPDTFDTCIDSILHMAAYRYKIPISWGSSCDKRIKLDFTR